jgi:hypothetical protein
MRISTALFIFVMLICCPTIQAKQTRNLRADKYIDALISAKIKFAYGNDGAHDGTLMLIGVNNAGKVENPIPEIKRIVNLGAKAIPLLIAHLDDTRLTSVVFDRNENPLRYIPVGYICYDILTYIARDTRKIINGGCNDKVGYDDGYCACDVKGYCFPPDDYIIKGSRYIARPEVHRVKLKWQRAYRKGYLKYQYPEMRKRGI